MKNNNTAPATTAPASTVKNKRWTYETTVESMCNGQAVVLKTTINQGETLEAVILKDGNGVYPPRMDVEEWIRGIPSEKMADAIAVFDTVFGIALWDGNEMRDFILTLQSDVAVPRRSIQWAFENAQNYLPF